MGFADDAKSGRISVELPNPSARLPGWALVRIFACALAGGLTTAALRPPPAAAGGLADVFSEDL